MVDDLGQRQPDCLAKGLTKGPTEQLVPRCYKQGVIVGPDREVSALIVELENEIIE